MKKEILRLLYNSFRLLRPRQWIKNLAIFAAITFSGQLFSYDIFINVFLGFLVFCLLSSAMYIINDFFDIEKDRLHPFKKFRPLAHNDVPLPVAFTLAIIFAVVSVFIAFSITPAFFISVLVYVMLQLSYSLVLKQIEILDILAIAAGYILRVYAGEFASGFHISVWLLLATIAFSLFLAVGKRRSELTLISKYPDETIVSIRQTLSHYSERLLDIYASMFATSTFISYSLFTFLENPHGLKVSFNLFIPDFLPVFFQRKWLMITILPVVYALMRYLQDVYEKEQGESPEKILISDTALLVSVFVWIISVIFVIYVIGG
ncbi:decaprenyl-phosphate phosphoribosyltransferase [Patescibacteria group bacterium]|nr:decaprenyl-phosphate phosphoribosyltransferase [Patescibacteria group bacterium]MCL5010055.1 decaprenyl-phosphate phosphoribosyltransferase [Patescibacteria group bacterium]